MLTEIKLIENRTEQRYRITVNGKSWYSDTAFSFTDDPNSQTEAGRNAKAAAFDEIINAQMNGKVSISYLSYQ